MAILKNDLFLSPPFWISFFQKKKKFPSSQQKLAHIYRVARIFFKFWWLRWSTAKTQCPQTYQPAVYVYELTFVSYPQIINWFKQLFRRNSKNLIYGDFNFGQFFHHFSLWLGTRPFYSSLFCISKFYFCRGKNWRNHLLASFCSDGFAVY